MGGVHTSGSQASSHPSLSPTTRPPEIRGSGSARLSGPQLDMNPPPKHTHFFPSGQQPSASPSKGRGTRAAGRKLRSALARGGGGGGGAPTWLRAESGSVRAAKAPLMEARCGGLWGKVRKSGLVSRPRGLSGPTSEHAPEPPLAERQRRPASGLPRLPVINGREGTGAGAPSSRASPPRSAPMC